MRGAEAVIRALEKEGVRYIAGFSGGGLAPLWEPLRTSDSISVFATRHERLGVEIGVNRADNNAGMFWFRFMKLYEVFAVEGEECAVLKSRIFQNLFVWNC